MTDLRIEYRDLASLIPADRNPKAHNIEGIKASIRSLGIADYVGLEDGRTGKLLGGHGRTEALTEMKAAGEDAPIGVNDALMPEGMVWYVPVLVGVTSRDDQHAEAVVIALNQHTIKGGWDSGLLFEQLTEWDDETLRMAVGFDPAAFDLLAGEAGQTGAMTDADAAWKGMPEFDQPDKQGVAVTVHMKTEEDADRFWTEVLRLELPRRRYAWWPEHDGHVGFNAALGYGAPASEGHLDLGPGHSSMCSLGPNHDGPCA